MSIVSETFVNCVQLKMVLKKKHNRSLQMSEKFIPEQKLLLVMPLMENLIWEMLIHITIRNIVHGNPCSYDYVRNKDIKETLKYKYGLIKLRYSSMKHLQESKHRK